MMIPCQASNKDEGVTTKEPITGWEELREIRNSVAHGIQDILDYEIV